MAIYDLIKSLVINCGVNLQGLLIEYLNHSESVQQILLLIKLLYVLNVFQCDVKMELENVMIKKNSYTTNIQTFF